MSFAKLYSCWTLLFQCTGKSKYSDMEGVEYVQIEGGSII